MPLRSGQVMAEKACHDLSSTTLHGLTQALEPFWRHLGSLMEAKQDKTREIGKAIVIATKPDELDALRAWAQAMLDIRSSGMPAISKAKAAIVASTDRKVLTPILQVAWQELKRVGWKERGLPARMAMGAAVTALTLSGQGAGIAALGGAIGVPLFVVFGAGGALAGVIIDEVRKK